MGNGRILLEFLENHSPQNKTTTQRIEIKLVIERMLQNSVDDIISSINCEFSSFSLPRSQACFAHTLLTLRLAAPPDQFTDHIR